jgi:hypothetical protein
VLASLSKSPFAGFAPWIIFSVVAKDVGWEVAATAGLVSSAILSYPSVERGTLKILDYAGLAFFAALAVLGLFLDRSELDWLEDYSTVISMGTIAVVVFASLRFVPFTEQYARETAPKEVQATASYKQTNRHLTTVWGFVFLVVAVDSLIQQLTDSSSALLDWIIPVAAIVGGFKYTGYYVAKARAGAVTRAPEARVGS